MIADFIFSNEGFSFLKNFTEKFDCSFKIPEPSGNQVVLEINGKWVEIKESEDVEAFKAAINESIRSGKNMLLERYKGSEIIFDDDVVL